MCPPTLEAVTIAVVCDIHWLEVNNARCALSLLNSNVEYICMLLKRFGDKDQFKILNNRTLDTTLCSYHLYGTCIVFAFFPI